jgi:hypothetical protein
VLFGSLLVFVYHGFARNLASFGKSISITRAA